ncbi:MAG: sigma 54-interacting transcriptional regulator [Candidatus Thorarchaeota archaeon]
MIQRIKDKIWKYLKEKDVSLAMIYNREGEILWHKGREIRGKTVTHGSGFCKSPIKKTQSKCIGTSKENLVVKNFSDPKSESARMLMIKSIIIQPISNDLFLYIDSGIKEHFTPQERASFLLLGEILEDIVKTIKNEGKPGGFCGNSKAIKTLRKLILDYSILNEPVLLLGETGVGKSHSASLIHQYSGRVGKFEVVNITAVTDTLFESVFFGYKKGAFTDARTDNKGLVQEAEKGTLYIDEIAEIPTSVQSKLLRFIETKKYRILGESFEREADVRIIVSTNRNLKEAIKNGEFRKDLYYRLQVLELEIPPLCRRKEDIKPFVMENIKYLRQKEIGDGFWKALHRHDWPGNMRELITVLKRAGLGSANPITGKDIDNIINNRDLLQNSLQEDNNICDHIWEKIKAGVDFWEAVKKPYLNRDIKRSEVRKIIEKAFLESGDKFSDILEILNLKKEEYKKFTNFLMVHKIMQSLPKGKKFKE